MTDTLPVALAITAIGMTLLFLVLALFYGLLALLTSAIRDRATTEVPDVAAGRQPAGPESSAGHEGDRLRAVAVAVALAVAEADAGTSPPPAGQPGEGPVSAWWTLHHGQRLAESNSTRRGR